MYFFEKEFVNDPELISVLRELGFKPSNVWIKAIKEEMPKGKIELVFCSTNIKLCYKLTVEKGGKVNISEVSGKELSEIRKDWEKHKKETLMLFKYRLLGEKLEQEIREKMGEKTWNRIQELRFHPVFRIR